jgi:hypothetical protein
VIIKQYSNIEFLCLLLLSAVRANNVRGAFIKQPFLPSLLVLPVLQSVLSGSDHFHGVKAVIFVLTGT